MVYKGITSVQSLLKVLLNDMRSEAFRTQEWTK